MKEEKLRGMYQTLRCLLCGKPFSPNPDFISFVCRECEIEERMPFSCYELKGDEKEK